VEIRGPLPFRIANAYGVTPPSSPKAPATEPAQRITQLVAGRVALPADPALASSAPAAGGESFPMYTRAADRVDVATRIAVGRTVDTTA
jgi:hypothetical protein